MNKIREYIRVHKKISIGILVSLVILLCMGIVTIVSKEDKAIDKNNSGWAIANINNVIKQVELEIEQNIKDKNIKGNDSNEENEDQPIDTEKPKDSTDSNDVAKDNKNNKSSSNKNNTGNQPSENKEISGAGQPSGSGQTTDSEKPVTKPENKPRPVCPNGENPNLPCDYIDLPAGYVIMDYNEAVKKMAEADENGQGYDGGWLTLNDGRPVYVICFY